jgi:hypothetical protein
MAGPTPTTAVMTGNLVSATLALAALVGGATSSRTVLSVGGAGKFAGMVVPELVKSECASSPANLIYFNEVSKGVHFAAWGQPELFATELRAAFMSLR